MTIYFNPRIARITPYVPGKTEEALKREYGLSNIVKLASNENPYGPSPDVKQAVDTALQQVHRYPDDLAPELRQLIANRWKLTSEQVQFGAGSSELIDSLIQGFVDDSGEMIVTEHGFGLYFVLGNIHHTKLHITSDQHYQQDLSAILSAITDDTRAIFIANPNNPTGTWIPSQQLHSFINNVPKHVLVVIDEAYHDYMTTPEYYSMARHIDEHENLVVLHTLSKAYGLSGCRFGYSLSQAGISEQLNKVRKPFNLSNLTLAAAYAALKDQKHLSYCVEKNTQGMAYLSNYFEQHQLPYLAKSGNFLTVNFGENATHITQELLKQGIIVRPLTPYNMPNHLRITIGTEAENKALTDALSKLLQA